MLLFLVVEQHQSTSSQFLILYYLQVAQTTKKVKDHGAKMLLQFYNNRSWNKIAGISSG